MVWVHTCVFPFYSELCGVRCGTHSTIRGVHTLFTPIDVQHAATEGHLVMKERGEKRERDRVSHRGNTLTFHTHVNMDDFHTLTIVTKQIVVFGCCVALFNIYKKRQEASGTIRALQRWLSALRPRAVDLSAGSCSSHMSATAGEGNTVLWSWIAAMLRLCAHLASQREKTTKELSSFSLPLSNPDLQIRLAALSVVLVSWSANATIF